MVSRDELKKKRQQAMGVVGKSREDTSAMYDRIIEHGDKVATIRSEAEQAHIDELDSQIAELKKDAEELAEFGQAARPLGGTATKAVAPATRTPVTGSEEALAALNSAQPKPAGWDKGDAYVGTHGGEQTNTAAEVGNLADVLPKT